MRRRGVRLSRAGRHVGLFVVVCLACAALAAVALLWRVPAEAESTSAALPLVVPVGARTDSSTQSMRVTFSVDPAPAVEAPRGGTVTSVSMRQGDGVANGDVLLGIDGVPIRALTGATPVFRDLGVGDRGADVRAVAEFLGIAAGLPKADVETDVFTGAMAAAVRRLEAASGLAPSGRFELAGVVYLPAGTTLASVGVRPGSHVEAGQEVAAASSRATSVSFAPDGSGEGSGLSGSRVTVEAGGERLTLRSLTPKGRELRELHALLAAHSALGGQGGEAPTGSPGAAAAASEVFDGIRVSRATAETRGTVPVTALFISAGGTQCVVVATRRDTEFRAERVAAEATSTELGVATVPASLIGSRVVRDPTALGTDVRSTCG